MNLFDKLLILYGLGMIIFTWYSYFIIVPKIPYRRHKRNLSDFIQTCIISLIWLPILFAVIADAIYNPEEEEQNE